MALRADKVPGGGADARLCLRGARSQAHGKAHAKPTPSTLQAKAHAKPKHTPSQSIRQANAKPTPTLSLSQDEELQQEAQMEALPHLDLLVMRIGSCLTDPPGTPTYLELTTLTLTPTLTPNPDPSPNPDSDPSPDLNPDLNPDPDQARPPTSSRRRTQPT